MKNSKKTSFLYRYRFVIGYVALILIFACAMFIMPKISPAGLIDQEMQSVVEASNLRFFSLDSTSIINAPYHILQKLSLAIYGFNTVGIRVPSVILAAFSALFIILLLNRWYKSDVAIIASFFTIFSTSFLFLSNSGTPTITYIFWLSFILWLGSKIAGNKKPSTISIFSFAIALALAAYTPQLGFVSILVILSGLAIPHLRYTVKITPHKVLAPCAALVAICILPLFLSFIKDPSIFRTLSIPEGLTLAKFLNNLSNAYSPFFSFTSTNDSFYLSPLFGLGPVIIAIIGYISSLKDYTTSKNIIVSLLLIFSILLAGFNQDIAISIILPLSILCATGLEYITGKWNSIFPENPYARLAGTVPIITIVATILISSLSNYISGYHYAGQVTKHFNNDLTLVLENLEAGATVVANDDHLEFYELLEKYHDIVATSELPTVSGGVIGSLAGPLDLKDYQLAKIITSANSRNSDRLYIYQPIITEKDITEEQ